MLVENHDREDLTPSEYAVAIQQLAGIEGVSHQATSPTMTGSRPRVVRKGRQGGGERRRHCRRRAPRAELGPSRGPGRVRDDKRPLILDARTAVEGPRADSPTWSRQLRQERDDQAVAAAVVAGNRRGRRPLVELANGCWLPQGAAWLDDLTRPEGRPHLHRGPAPELPRSRGGGGRERRRLRARLRLPRRREPRPHQPDPRSLEPPGRSTAKGESGMTDEEKAERRKVVANNKAWEISRSGTPGVRHRASGPTQRSQGDAAVRDRGRHGRPCWIGRRRRRQGGLAHRKGDQPRRLGSHGSAGTCQRRPAMPDCPWSSWLR